MALQNAKNYNPVENMGKKRLVVFGGKAFTYICRPNTRASTNCRFYA